MTEPTLNHLSDRRFWIAVIWSAGLSLAQVACGSSGTGEPENAGTGGHESTGGATGGGNSMTGARGGSSGPGGASGTAGGPGSGGSIGTGGTPGSGGSVATGGTSATGGAGATSGLGGTAGTHPGGAGGASGGHAGGAAGAGGTHTGGIGGAGTGGTTGSGGGAGAAAAIGPCDLFAAGNTPCVAAHSTVRALFGAYDGNLYQVRRASDRTTKDIGVLSAGGFADSSIQDSFCAGTTCTISIIYDQSGKGNHLRSAPAGGNKPSPDSEASATRLKLTVSGHPVYAVYIDRGMGYRIDATTGIATGDAAETEYMVASGTHVNGGCCFDYGNAETNNNDDGNGTMEAVYLGTATYSGFGSGNGPWVMADLENGLYAGVAYGRTAANTPLTSTYVTAMVKGKAGSFALKGGDASTGTLKTMYDGPRPTPGYNPMRKQGAIILGIGGDNTNDAVGTFFEGVMTAGYSTDATDNAVQANIVAAGYGK